jgi:hypothetical protein
MLRKLALAAVAALGAGFSLPAEVSAMPAVTVHLGDAPLIQVRNGCGRGWHLNRWGRCAPNHRYHPYRHHGWYRPYYHDGWYGRPQWRHHHHWRRHHHHRYQGR